MTSELAPLLLVTVTLGLLAVPVAPALYELKTRKDASPLPTSRHDGRIANFAEVFRSRAHSLSSQLERCRSNGEIARVRVEKTEALVIGIEKFDFGSKLIRDIGWIICAQRATIPADSVVEADVYAETMLELSNGATARAALCRGDILLREKSTILRWLHADGSAVLKKGSRVFGRLSADESIRLECGAVFQHMHAPLILTLDSEDSPYLPARCECETVPRETGGTSSRSDAFASRPRIRVQGDFVLPAGELLDANVVATGKVRFERGARFLGNVKSYGDVILADKSCAHGSIVCEGTVRIGSGCFAAGPILAENEVVVEEGSCIGAAGTLTTLSSRTITLASGCELHGSVWARLQGSVLGSNSN